VKDIRILIHHHAVAYQGASKAIYLPSFIGRWINALSDHMMHIGLLLHESETLRPEQDDVIQAKNVSLWSLGAPGKTWDRMQRINRLRKVCAQAAQQADGLLVRGVTPRQMNVWDATPLHNRAFLLVGSMLETKPITRLTFWGIYQSLMWRWRRVEVLQMARQGFLLANSPHLVNELARLNRPATFVPTNSIRLDEFAPFYVREVAQPLKILFCGRVVPEKGIRELIHAMAKLNLIQPCVLDVVGPVEPSFRLVLDELTKELGIHDSVKWHGRIPYGEALFSFYRQADVFLLPTYYEGFPHVIWEAAANCCPVITTSVGGIPALLTHEKQALLIPPKDIEAIVISVKRLFSETTLRENIVKQAYHHAQAFTVEACARKLASVLSQEWK